MKRGGGRGGNDGGEENQQQGFAHRLGNRCAIPTFPPPDYCYIRQEKLCLKGASLTACSFSLQAHPSIRKDCVSRFFALSQWRFHNV